MADKFNQKILAYTSVMLLIVYHILYLKAPNFIYLFMAQIVLSISLILIDIGISTWLTRETRKLYDDAQKIDFFSHLENEIEAITGLLVSFLFIALSYLFKNFPSFYEMIYIATSLLLSSLFLLLYFVPVDKEKNPIITPLINNNRSNQPKFLIFNSIKNFYVVIFLIISVVLWFAYQPLFHYWQPLLASKNFNFSMGSFSFKFEDINFLLGLSFCIMNISLYFFHKMIKNLSETKTNFYKLGMILSIIGCFLFFIICCASNVLSAILCFSLLHGTMSCLWKIARNQFIKNYDSHNFGKVIAMSVAACRLMNIIIFYACYKFCSTIDHIKVMYYLCAMALLITGVIFIKWNRKDKVMEIF